MIIVVGVMIFLTPKSPAAPERLLGSAASDSVRLDWPASADDSAVERYEVYRGRGKERVIVCSGRQNFCVDNNVQAGQIYDYFVVAVGRGGKSAEMSYSIRTLTVDPRLKPPSLVRAQAVTPHSVWLTWMAPDDAPADLTYEVIRDGGKVADVAATDFHDDGVQPGASYTFTIRSFDRSSNAESLDSEPAAVLVPTDPLPSLPPSATRSTRPPLPPPPTKTTDPPSPPTSPPSPTPSVRQVAWRNQDTGGCIDDSSDQHDLRVLTCNGSNFQRFRLLKQSNGTFALQNVATNRCIDDSPDLNLRAITCYGNEYQRWVLSATANGLNELRNQATGRCLDDSSEFGLRAISCYDNSHQKFSAV